MPWDCSIPQAFGRQSNILVGSRGFSDGRPVSPSKRPKTPKDKVRGKGETTRATDSGNKLIGSRAKVDELADGGGKVKAPKHSDLRERSPKNFFDQFSEGKLNDVGLKVWHVFAAGISGAIMILYIFNVSGPAPKDISFQEFLGKILTEGGVERIEVDGRSKAYVYMYAGSGDASMSTSQSRSDSSRNVRPSPSFTFSIGNIENFEQKLEEAQEIIDGRDLLSSDTHVNVIYRSPTNRVTDALRVLLPLLPVAMLVMYFRSLTAKGGVGGRGGGIMSVGQAKITVIPKELASLTTFKDVAGCDEAKVEIMEFVKFLKTPGSYERLGAKIPKGALLSGPPGTGKTLLAKATAGEAGVSFLSMSGSDFMEMFVGVGPSRIRDLFEKARKSRPCIIFIDEIDAIGRARGKGGIYGNDERENTLNQLLVEMDGFQALENVVVLAGTNRPDVLDKALLRPGRFDRLIVVDLPDVSGRQDILEVHLKKVKLGYGSRANLQRGATTPHSDTHDSDLIKRYAQKLSYLTPGFSGADIENLVNEAALIAARGKQVCVTMDSFEAAVDRVVGGIEKRGKFISKEERRTIAYHEAGHAVCGWFLANAEPILKVSIIPRGSAALGFAQYLPKEQFLQSADQLNDAMVMSLGGRAAEQLVFGRISTGAQNDLEKVTKLALDQVTKYGMSSALGPLAFRRSLDNDAPEIDRHHSNETQELIDSEVRSLIDAAYERCLKLLRDKGDAVEKLAEELLLRDVLSHNDISYLLGPRPAGGVPAETFSNIDRERELKTNECKTITGYAMNEVGDRG